MKWEAFLVTVADLRFFDLNTIRTMFPEDHTGTHGPAYLGLHTGDTELRRLLSVASHGQSASGMAELRTGHLK